MEPDSEFFFPVPPDPLFPTPFYSQSGMPKIPIAGELEIPPLDIFEGSSGSQHSQPDAIHAASSALADVSNFPPSPPSTTTLPILGRCEFCGLEFKGDPVASCGRCGLVVHAACLALHDVCPAADWTCAPCRAGLAPVELECFGCGQHGGLLIQDRGGSPESRWIHACCGLWLPEVRLTLRKEGPSVDFNACAEARCSKQNGMACRLCKLRPCPDRRYAAVLDCSFRPRAGRDPHEKKRKGGRGQPQCPGKAHPFCALRDPAMALLYKANPADPKAPFLALTWRPHFPGAVGSLLPRARFAHGTLRTDVLATYIDDVSEDARPALPRKRPESEKPVVTSPLVARTTRPRTASPLASASSALATSTAAPTPASPASPTQQRGTKVPPVRRPTRQRKYSSLRPPSRGAGGERTSHGPAAAAQSQPPPHQPAKAAAAARPDESQPPIRRGASAPMQLESPPAPTPAQAQAPEIPAQALAQTPAQPANGTPVTIRTPPMPAAALPAVISQQQHPHGTAGAGAMMGSGARAIVVYECRGPGAVCLGEVLLGPTDTLGRLKEKIRESLGANQFVGLLKRGHIYLRPSQDGDLVWDHFEAAPGWSCEVHPYPNLDFLFISDEPPPISALGMATRPSPGVATAQQQQQQPCDMN
ncbi:hypothetical protein PAPYR_3338 [Paratrimastix pyriformis]|uniref:PHD-type domain-containing protein n=1 Tax=Paratrimastix pyriformis TaxID=342808 RepID=A0ABQ8UPE1_9EUKA|nr:hypothetical protein PAPYR_3338 [Paratrimastix pyriformis]